MRLLNKIVRIVHSGQDRHGLHSHHELRRLQIPIKLVRKLGQECKHDTVAHIVEPADEEHSQVPPQLILVVVVKLNESCRQIESRWTLTSDSVPILFEHDENFN